MPPEIPNNRRPEHSVDPLFTDRWSPRAFDGSEMPVETLMTILEAGRWAPSSYNSQPWRFVWGRRGTPAFDAILSILVPFNQGWCRDASALVVLASSETMVPPGASDPVPSKTHSFDAGSAWMAAAIQAHQLGWYTHGMVGLDFGQAAETLKVPLGFAVEMAFAIGKRGDPATLPEAIRGREFPSDRKPMAELAFEGAFPG